MDSTSGHGKAMHYTVTKVTVSKLASDILINKVEWPFHTLYIRGIGSRHKA